MADSNPVDLVLEFLKRNKFTKAESALRSELGKIPDLNGFIQKPILPVKEPGARSNEELNGVTVVEEVRKMKTTKHSRESRKDSPTSSGTEASKELIVKEVDCGTGRNGFDSRWKSYCSIGEQRKVNAGVGTSDKNFTFSQTSGDAALDLYSSNFRMKNGPALLPQDDSLNLEKRTSWPGIANNSILGLKHESTELKVIDHPGKSSSVSSKDDIFNDSFARFNVSANPRELMKECYVKTILPFSWEDTSTSISCASSVIDKRDGKKNAGIDGIRAAIKEEEDEVGRTLFFRKVQGSEYQRDEFPRLPPVKLKYEEKSFNTHWEEKYDHDGPNLKILNSDNAHLIGSFLDVPIGQEINHSGERLGGGRWLSVSQDITEDTSDLVSGFATTRDGLDESVNYSNVYWDSDEYEDDDDVGYTRQPIEDETWFLAHEINHPSDHEKGTGHGIIPEPQEKEQIKSADDDQSCAGEESYFSGQRFLQSENSESLRNQYDGNLMDEKELNLIRSETDEFICFNGDRRSSVRSIGVGINSDVADIGCEVHESRAGGSSEGDIEYFNDHDVGIGYHVKKDTYRTMRHNAGKYLMSHDKFVYPMEKQHIDGGFSFPLPRNEQVVAGETRENANVSDESDEYDMANEDMLSFWRHKRSESSRDVNLANVGELGDSSLSSISNYDQKKIEKDGDPKTAAVGDGEAGTSLEDEEAAAVQEQMKQIQAQEEEFETFYLKIVHRKNRTGFEEDKNFNVVLNSVIAGRYHVTEYLGSAAFSKAIQAHDLHTGIDVCVKIIKNNKDFFDQSLDEIKLLKYVNKHDPADKYHILRLYDYFYYQEHLLIVCELLKANLYEFQKFNRESGGEVYFTMPRLQSITIQCLEALQFLHSLGLIHCDLKPENILVKSYSRCEVKVIDLGSSCFETDHLCSYVQSRSYRAPEVILGLPYDKKIDVWSLGCILAELCTGNVLFQNDSPASLLARVIGIAGSIEPEMLEKGRDTYKYFTKNGILYERNQESNKLEYLIPKKSSLRHRLPMGDRVFIDFVAHLLEINPKKRPSAADALKHAWLQHPYEPISS